MVVLHGLRTGSSGFRAFVGRGAAALLLVCVAGTAVRAGDEACGDNSCDDNVCLFGGIKNAALGDSKLSLTRECVLLVDENGDSGEDGFQQTEYAGTAANVINVFDVPNWRRAEVGAVMETRFSGKGALGGPDTLFAVVKLSVPDAPEKTDIEFAFPNVGARTFDLMILKGGQVVGGVNDTASPMATFQTTDLHRIGSVIEQNTTSGSNTSFSVAVRFDTLTTVAPEGGSSAEGDAIVVVANGGTLNLVTHTLLLTRITNLNAIGIVFEYGGSRGGECNDNDHDGYGNPGDPTCPKGPQRDCNDSNPNIHPARPEICNGADDNCNQIVDEGFDVDGDGSSTCRGDCNDNNPNIHPGAPEKCNGIDDDCDLLIDEGFCLPGNQPDPDGSGTVPICTPVGEPCVVGNGECAVIGVVACRPSPGTLPPVLCQGTPGAPGVEGPTGAANCSDGRDNDCDAKTDYADPNCIGPEICDGLDNDNDQAVDETFPTLGNLCFVGVGVCRSTGVFVCKEDGTGVECSATPDEPSTEGPPGSHKCADGLDNDCDGLTDCRGPTGAPGDPDCFGVEKCDGEDNNCNGQVDEPFASALGDACARGIGACLQVGEIICTPDGNGVTCSAVPLPGFYEGPGDCSCSDGLDNDCDGKVDENDPSCNSAQLLARCSLEECRKKVHPDCYSGHRVAFDSIGGDPGAVVTAELLALREDGTVLETLPVENGDILRLQSRRTGFGFAADSEEIALDLITFKKWQDCDTGPNNPPYLSQCEIFDDDCDGDVDLVDFAAYQNAFGETRTSHTVLAPIPLLRVTADDGLNKSYAYCSNTPYLDVVKPDFTVVSESEGDIVNVLAALPLVNPASIQMKVNGFNVLAALGINPATDFPGGPYKGMFTMSHPGCDSQRVVEVCDLFVHAGAIDELSPNILTATIRGLGGGGHVVVVDGDKVAGSFPDPAEVRCNVDDVRDNGIAQEIGIEVIRPQEQQVIAGPNTGVVGFACHGRKIEATSINDFNVPLGGQTFFNGDEENSADTYRLGFNVSVPQNNLRAELNGAPPTPGRFDPGANRLIAQAADADFNTSFDTVFFAVGNVIPTSTSFRTTAPDDVREELAQVAAEVAAVEVDKAFTLAMNAGALTTFFSELCQAIGPEIATGLEERLTGYKSDKFTIPTPWPLCDVKNARMKVNSVDIDPSAFDCQITPLADKLQLTLTLPEFSASTHFSGHCDEYFIVCLVEVIIDTGVDFNVPPITVTFEITEGQILAQQPMQDTNFSLGGDPVVIDGTINDNSEVNCLVGIILDILDFLLTIVTFGCWDPGLDEFEFELTDDKLKERISEKGGNMHEFEEFKFDNEELIPEYDSKLDASLSEVQITPNGIAAAVSASFEATVTDPDVANIPGTPLTPAPLPQPVIAGADEITVSVSDDVFNQLLASLVQSGKLKTLFEDVRVLGDFLPEPDTCDALGPVLEPRCVGMLGGDCNQFALPSRKELCEEWKQKMEDRVLSPGSAVIIYGRVDVPPKILIDDNPATQNRVEVALRYSQISLALLVDRDGDGHLSGSIASLPPCFGPSPGTVGECAIWEACLNVNVTAQLFLPPGELLLRMQVLDVAHDLSTGTICGGGITDLGDELIDGAAEGAALDRLNERLRESTPDLKTKGLDFGGLVSFENARLMAIENDGNPDFDDYIAITGKLVVNASLSRPPASTPQK